MVILNQEYRTQSGYKVLLRLQTRLINKDVIQYWADELILNWYD